jgi:hypothetical protein
MVLNSVLTTYVRLSTYTKRYVKGKLLKIVTTFLLDRNKTICNLIIFETMKKNTNITTRVKK